jgi:hypothetical protein
MGSVYLYQNHSIKTIAILGSESISNVENKGDKVKFNKIALLSTYI